ncbi:hypothetical protein [Bosea sp. (in: a-proteobacteria)]|uniref:beta strand repeat-containing protein n=1 Tax=Bosea sp. (in: a-proteobacteria) TaxID=1871050 RepID=UPI0026365E7E|nr:hypothetical protein [Bosea sp. (in: a-proteobacteria)]MCO5090684.1 hypothetical protein [Bosea sp. (in: a-proteobacteria)]
MELVLQGENRFGEVSQYAVPIASYTTGLTVTGSEVGDKGVMLLSSPTQGLVNGAAVWAVPTGTPGTFDIKFKSFSFQPAAIARDTGYFDTYNLGPEITLASGISNYSSLDFNNLMLPGGPAVVIGYTTRAAGAPTQDVVYQAFDGQGQAIGPQVSFNTRAGAPFLISDNGTDFLFVSEKITAGVASIELRSFSPETGAVGASTTIATNFATLFNMSVLRQSDGSFDIVAEGKTATNQHFLNIYQADASFHVSAPPVTITLASANSIRMNAQRMANDSLVLAYTDQNKVHLAVYDAAGVQIDDFIVPGLTNFDRIRSLGQNQFELVWRETVSGAENAVKAAVYDVNTSARNVDQSGSSSSVWLLGSHFNDVLTGGSAGDIFKGYAGNDLIIGGSGQDIAKYTGNKADYTLVRNVDGSWTVTDTRGGSPDGTDTLRSVEILDFADGQKQLISVQATQLTQTGPVFLDNAHAPITGVVWGRPHRGASSGDGVFIGSYSPTAGYVPGGPNPQTLVLAGQDKFGELDETIVIANYTSGKTVRGNEVQDKSVIISKQASGGAPAEGFAIWVEPTDGGPAGTFDVKLQALTFAANQLAYETGSPSVTLVGVPTTLFAGVSEYNGLDWNVAADGTIVVGYTTRAVGSVAPDYWFAKVDPLTGTAAYAPQKFATTYENVAISVLGGDFTLISEDRSGPSAKLTFQHFDADTGTYGPVTGVADPGSFSDMYQVLELGQSDGSRMLVIEGIQLGTGAHILQTLTVNAANILTSTSTPVVLAPGQSLGRLQHQVLANGLNAVAYADNNVVHLSLFDVYGNLVSDTVVPGLTTFDRLRNLGQNQVELIWRETVSGNENVVKAAIYDANDGGRFVDFSGSGSAQWVLGSHVDDVLTGGSAGDIFKGYGGNDLIIGGSGQDIAKYTGNKADYTLVRNGDGSWTVTDTRVGSPDGVDTLRSIEIADFADGQQQLISTQATQLTELGPVFRNGADEPITGVVWGRPHRGAWNGDVVFIDGYSPTAGYTPGGPNAQTLVVAGQDKFGDLDGAVVIANYTSGKTVNGAEVLDKSVIMYKQTSGGPAQGFAVWVAPTDGGAPGTFDVKLQALNFAASNLAYVGSPSITLVGAPTNLFAGVANYSNLDWNVASDGTIVAGYGTRAVGASTMDYWYAKVNPATGTAAYAPQKIATGNDYVVMSVSGNQFTFISEDRSSGEAKLKFQNFNANTGALGPVVGVVDPGHLQDIYQFLELVQSDGSRLFVAEGIQQGTGAHVLQTFAVSAANTLVGTPTTTVLASGQSLGRLQHQLLANGMNVVGYADNGEVHLSLFDKYGNLVSDMIVPDLTTFDRLRGLGQNQVELIWREPVSGAENVVKAAIFDGNDDGRVVNSSGSGSAQWILGSHFDDILLGGSNADIFKGYGGDDFIEGGGGVNKAKFTGDMADYDIVDNGDGSWTVTDLRAGSPDGQDFLRRVQVLEFADRAITLGLAANADTGATVAGVAAGNVLTNDIRPAGDSLFVSSVNGLSANVGIATAGLYGTLTLNPNGSYSYVASGASGATGSHLHDVFTYTMTDFTVGAFFGSASASSGTVTLDITLNRAAVVSASAYTPAHRSTSVAASALFSVADDDGDAITKYEFWDDTTASTSGHWTLSGAAQGSARGIVVNAADLANMQWTVGSTADTVFIRAFDGFEWSAWKSFTIATAPESIPVVTASATVTPAHGATSLIASSLFSVTDADGDAITKYRLWDGNASASSGHWTVNGVEKGASLTIEITAAEFANTVWTAGSVSDAVSVQVFDGVAWSAWKDFTIAAPPNAAPTVTAATYTPAHGALTTQASLVFTTNDADGDAITKYRLWDGNASASSGHWTVNGVEKGANLTIEITAAEFANTVWSAGSVSDAVSVQVFDGVAWSAWANFTIAAPANAAPTVTAATYTPAHGALTTQASLVFTTNDADGDAITKYRLWDGNASASSGHWTVNGVEKGADLIIEITAAEFANTVWSAGSVGDTVSVQVFDGVAWSAWANFTIAPPPNVAPTVTAATYTPAHGALTTQASLLFTANDADGDAITKYRLWDGNASALSGHWTVNGIAKGANLIIEITAAEFANTVWAAGSMSDAVSVQVFDGIAWSAWGSFTIAAPPNAAPTVTAATYTPAHEDLTIQASALFTTNDADGDAITKYRLWDGNANTSSGHWTVNGVAKGANLTIEITAAEFANTVWSVGSVGDTVSVQVFDGIAWSAWKDFTIAAPPNAAPTVTAATYTPAHGALTTQASLLFTTNDADGDAITKYRLWDGNANTSSGHWTVNGVEKGASLTIEITAAEFANTVWTAGSVSDAVSVQVFDGVAWSAWKDFTIAAPPNAAPTVTAATYTPAHGALTTQASLVFTTTDADGDAITKYRLWDGNASASSGHWTVNGVEKGANLTIEITAAEFANTVWSAGSVSDAVSVQVFDGVAWSAWKDFTIAAPPNVAPTVTAATYTPAHGALTTQAALLFTANDADGDTITKYRLWDGNASASSGHWTVNGVEKGANLTIEITAAEFAQTVWSAGSVSDTVSVQVFDGVAWSAWKDFTIAAPPNAAPTVSATDKAATHGQVFAASALFSAADTDGDTITKYQIWDGNANASSGHWTVNGATQDAGRSIEIGASDLANTTFQSGSGSDLLYARAFDGLIWGDWKAFTVTAPLDVAPVVHADAGYVVATNEIVEASAFFDVTDAENDTITKYEFWDSNPAANSGYWSVNGTPQHAQEAIEVLAADLASASFTGASAETTDQLYVRAFDGYLWSDWKAFNVTSLSHG